jgi:hypothetical protein
MSLPQRTATALPTTSDSYQATLHESIRRTRMKLALFEARYQTTTHSFMANMTAEDLDGGDLEYVEWAGEASMLKWLEAELLELNLTNPELG